MTLPSSNAHFRRGILSHRARDNWRRTSGICAGVIAFVAVEARGQVSKPSTQPSAGQVQTPVLTGAKSTKFKGMSLDELMDIEVFSVSRRESTIGQSAAAVTVISQDDIRRSGANSIPEALRMVPGLEVAQIDNSTYAITARGFNNNTANKLLVLMDGRSVYTPLYSGTFWDVQNTMMDDIDRIEVIRGPAGATWGANAVNGVINILTKDARDTQGVLVSAGGGTEERNFESARYGFKLNDTAFGRVYFEHFERDQTAFANGMGGADDFFMSQGGFRIDSEPSVRDHFTVQGDIYQGNRNNLNDDDTTVGGGNVMGRWSRTFDNGSDMKLQMYYDRTDRDIPLLYTEDRDTVDVDFQYHFPLGNRHDITWGLGYRFTAGYVNNGIIQFVPEDRTEQLFSCFIQDEIQLIPDKLRLTLGSKLEHNDFTGYEVQPSARLLWTISQRQSAWAAISRAVRTPSQLEDDLQIIAPTASLIGNKDFESETLIAYELGYRVQPTDWLSLDVATFYNNYDKLRSLEFNGTIFSEENKLNGQTYGVELGSTVNVAKWWTIRAAYTYLKVQLQTDPGSTDLSSIATVGNDPKNQAYLRSSMDLARNVEFDLSGRYVSRLINLDVPGYVAVDARLAWKPTDRLELSVVGKNLFDNQHPEFNAPAGRLEIQRGVYAMVKYSW